MPLYHEEENVSLLHAAICEAVRPLGLRTEIVFVDDGSKDRTFERCLELPRTDPDLRVGQVPPQRRADRGHGRRASTMPAARC